MKNYISKTAKNLISYLKFKINLVVKIFRILFSRFYLRIFAVGLNVPKWHLNATFEARVYKNEVIKLCNKYKTNNVIEVGCGVGEILCRLDAPFKYGLDLNRDTLKLCRRLNKKIEVIHTDIMQNNVDLIEIMQSINKDQTILIVMVNWLHEYSEIAVTNMLNSIFSIDRKIILIADIYERKELSKISNNKIVHKFEEIKNINSFRRFKNIDKVRDIAIISNINI